MFDYEYFLNYEINSVLMTSNYLSKFLFEPVFDLDMDLVGPAWNKILQSYENLILLPDFLMNFGSRKFWVGTVPEWTFGRNWPARLNSEK